MLTFLLLVLVLLLLCLAGCGVGGSSRQISRRFGTSMTGISLSPVQVYGYTLFQRIFFFLHSVLKIILKIILKKTRDDKEDETKNVILSCRLTYRYPDFCIPIDSDGT